MQQKQEYEVLSWNQVYELLMELARKIKESGFNPDVILGISRGGLIPSRVLSDLIDNTNLVIVRVKLYFDVNKKLEKPIMTEPISVGLEGKSILIIDDIVDTGESLHLVCESLRGSAKIIKTLTLYIKPWSCLKPDFYARETLAWVIFPWELHETIRLLGSKVVEEGRTLREVEEKLIRIGLDPSVVKRFVIDLWGSEK